MLQTRIEPAAMPPQSVLPHSILCSVIDTRESRAALDEQEMFMEWESGGIKGYLRFVARGIMSRGACPFQLQRI